MCPQIKLPSNDKNPICEVLSKLERTRAMDFSGESAESNNRRKET
jgi:hypothetical protein